MKVETKIKLDRFQPRPYQLPLMRELERGDRKRFLCVWARRAGKDVCAFNAILRAALKKVAVYYYIFPTYSQAKKVIWDSITNTGHRFLDYIPSELIKSKNSQEMKIVLINGSLIQLVGSDNVDSLVGTNPAGVVFSEYALQSPLAYQYLRPILLANQGWSLFISTPRGKNHFWELYNIAINNPKEWFVSKLSVLDTNHISMHEIRKEVAEGLMSEDLSQQEYFVSFLLGVEGSYYAKIIDRMRVNGQVDQVPWEPSFKVHTAWDLGVRDMTSIIFFQITGQVIRVIDCYEKNKEGLEHYVNILRSKPYTYGRHFAPHDIAIKEWGSGLTRIEKAKRLGIQFIVVDNIAVVDGIEAVRSTLPKVWIDEKKCAPLIKALENYRQEYDTKKRVYKKKPLHDVFSNFADAMRYLALSLPKTRDSMTPDDLERIRNEALYGSEGQLPPVFRDDYRGYN